MPRILSFGSLNLDYVYHVPHFVRPGETMSPLKREVNCGGKGLNQSIAAALAGASVFHAGKIGRDGQPLIDALRRAGADTSLVAMNDMPTGHAIIQVEPSGQNCILLYAGSNGNITRTQVDHTLAGFGPGDYLILQNEINELSYILDQAAERGLFIVFNPSPMEDALLRLPLERVSLLICNEIEGAALAGCRSEEQIPDALRTRFPHSKLLLTLGSRGSIYDDGVQQLRQPAYKVRAVDTTAAGDTFTGYFVASLAAGLEPRLCLELATRAAAIAVTRAGAAPSIPRMDEVRRCTFSVSSENMTRKE